MRRLYVVVIGFVLGACGAIAPATVPEQLEYTPGPPVVITDVTYENVLFRVAYPSAWRTVTSPANAAPWVVFASPQDDAVIVIAADEADTHVPPANVEGSLVREERSITQGDSSVLAVLIASEAQIDTFMPLFEQIVSSVTLVD